MKFRSLVTGVLLAVAAVAGGNDANAQDEKLKFYVNFPPTFTPTGSFPGIFTPRPLNPLNPSNPAPLPRTFTVNMPAFDSDPFVPGLKPSGPGGPSGSSLFRYTATFTADCCGDLASHDKVGIAE